MEARYTRGSKSMLHHWSVRSLVIGVACLIALAAAGIADAGAIVQYIRTGNGSDVMLVYGSIITIVAAAVFLAMGLSISDDDLHEKM